MYANDEVGTIQPVTEIAALTRPWNILLHTDAAQSAGKIEVDVQALGVDLLTLAGHKFYAISGVLAAMGIESVRAAGAVRLSVGWMTTKDDLTRAAAALIGA